ncbi:MAG: cell division protein SepF [Bacilli bacterium]|jgi:FtsZ-interacting cell division protein YlmF|nr:cell division protein SepF [Bacilli bacterium]MDD3422663.1 cell division protein SepF [Bacilli bacterium]MDD4065550.1 cell division protein SepF [Bacilli bacterium]
MPESKLKRFLFPTEDEAVTPRVENERNAGYYGAKSSAPEVEESDGNLDFASLKVPLQESRRMSPQTGKSSISDAGVYAPNSFEDAEKIAKELILGKPIIVNLENLLRNETTKASATRVIDFLCGVAYALKTDVKRINNSTFIFTSQQEQGQATLRDEVRSKLL